MSASSKKKLRREQEAAKLTEKQQAAQKEAKKVNLYTTLFVVTMAVLLVVALVVGVKQTITNTGMREKNTIALTVGDHKLNSVEMNYFYLDAVNNFYSQYGSMASFFGLDLTLPLDEQISDEEAGTTWADDFMESAKTNAQAVYAMADAAKAAGFQLTTEELTEIENSMATLELYAAMYGYSDADAYLQAMYGKGAAVKSYQEYAELTTLASSYYQSYTEGLTYDEAALQEAAAANPGAYSSYTYHSYYLSASRFRTGGTTDEEGNTTYSEQEIADAEAAAEEAAKSLTSSEITSVEALDAAIAALPINEGTTASSTLYEDTLYSSISSLYADWLTDSSRKEGDVDYFASTYTSTNDAGEEVTTTNGYYVVCYISTNDNTFPLTNVRHILVSPEHNHEDDETHDEDYTEEELAAAKATAEEILAQWEAGDKTEESFAALANEKSSDGDGTTGGLYENVYPGQMVTNFNDWCFDASRKSGDTGIVESTYGYHVMYFVGNSDISYRDYQIEQELRSIDSDNWYTETVEALTVTDGNTQYVNTSLVLSQG